MKVIERKTKQKPVSISIYAHMRLLPWASWQDCHPHHPAPFLSAFLLLPVVLCQPGRSIANMLLTGRSYIIRKRNKDFLALTLTHFSPSSCEPSSSCQSPEWKLGMLWLLRSGWHLGWCYRVWVHLPGSSTGPILWWHPYLPHAAHTAGSNPSAPRQNPCISSQIQGCLAR